MQQNECKNFQLNTTSWEFEKQWTEPDKIEWQEIINYKVEDSQKRQTIPVYARLKVQEKQIYLEVFIKYWNLREVTTKDTDRTITLKDKYSQNNVMLSAIEEDKEVRYYNSKQLLGTFYKNKLTD